MRILSHFASSGEVRLVLAVVVLSQSSAELSPLFCSAVLSVATNTRLLGGGAVACIKKGVYGAAASSASPLL